MAASERSGERRRPARGLRPRERGARGRAGTLPLRRNQKHVHDGHHHRVKRQVKDRENVCKPWVRKGLLPITRKELPRINKVQAQPGNGQTPEEKEAGTVPKSSQERS